MRGATLPEMLLVFPFLLLGGMTACGQDPLAASGTPSQTFSVDAGRQVFLTLQTIGLGEFDSPPNISGDAVRFIEVIPLTPPVPAGPRQLFRFQAVQRGRAVIVFHNSQQGVTVEDTVNVH
jgi:hypothetical protein